MVTVYAAKTKYILLGRVGENDHTQVVFNVASWLAEYPSAVIGLYNRPSRQAESYPVANIRQDGTTVIWTVKSSDVVSSGRGMCELVAISGETIVKSAIYQTNTFEALDGIGTPPAPWAAWQQAFVELKGEAEAAAESAEEAASHYPKIEDGVWYIWDAQSGEYVSTGIDAQGEQGPQGETGATGATGATGPQGIPGQDGVSPAVTVETITGGHQVTITDAAHPDGQSFDVMDGTDGTDGTTFTPAVSSEGVISWTNDGNKQNPSPVNIKGPAGADGTNGTNGTDGVSPTVTVTDISGGHRVTITDADHPGGQTFDVMDGADGQPGQTGPAGPGVASGGTQGQMLVKKSGTDYDTEWLNQPNVPVQDVQVNGVSALDAQGVANVPRADADTLGVVRTNPSYGVGQLESDTRVGILRTFAASEANIKTGTDNYKPITSGGVKAASFYGLAKAAGDSTQSASSNVVGQYTDAAKDKIQQMLGIIDMIAPHEGTQASQAYSIGGAFCFDGKLYKATAAIAIGDAIAPGTNCTQTTLIALIGGN